MPAGKESVAGILACPESELVGHIGLTEIPEGKAVSLEPAPKKYQLNGTVMSSLGGAEAAKACIGSSENVSDLSGGNLSAMAQQDGDDVQIALKSIDCLKGCEIACCKPGVFVVRLDALGSRR